MLNTKHPKLSTPKKEKEKESKKPCELHTINK
jgi:hypothetical protein